MCLDILTQERKKPVAKIKLRLIGQGFGLQSAIVPFVADVDVRVGMLIPFGPVFFQRDQASFIRRGQAGRRIAAVIPFRPLPVLITQRLYRAHTLSPRSDSGHQS